MQRTLALISALWLLVGLLGPAHAQVRRCTAPDGTQIFTDRKCADVGASNSVRPTTAATTRYSRRSVCPASVQDLAYALETAAQSGDVNKIAGLYDWAGMSSSSAYSLMGRLQQVADRSFIGVQILQSSAADSGASSISGIRVEQTLRDRITPASTVFGLRRRLGCWWLHL